MTGGEHDSPLPTPTDDRAFRIALAVIVGVGALWYVLVGYTQWASGRTYVSDVGVFHVLVSGPLHGTFLRTPLAPYAEGNYFGIHFQPGLFLLTPLHLLHNSALTLVTCLGLALALAAVPLALLAREVTGDRVAALAFAALWLGNHFTLSFHLAQHPEALAMPAIMTLMLAMHRRRAALAWGALVVALSIKQDFAIWLFLLCAAWAASAWPGRRLPLSLAGGCVAWYAIAEFIRSLCGAAGFERLGMTPTSRFASMGETRGAIAWHMLTSPLDMAQRILRWPLLALLLCAGPWLLADWRRALAGIAGAAVFLATDDHIIRDLQYYYSYGALPLLFGASVLAWGMIARRIDRWRPGIARWGLAAYAAGAVVAGLLLPTRTDAHMHRPFPITERDALIVRAARLLPREGVVAAQFNYFTRVPARRDLFPLRDWSLGVADYIFMSRNARGPDIGPEEAARMSAEIAQQHWELLYEDEGILIVGRVRSAP